MGKHVHLKSLRTQAGITAPKPKRWVWPRGHPTLGLWAVEMGGSPKLDDQQSGSRFRDTDRQIQRERKERERESKLTFSLDQGGKLIQWKQDEWAIVLNKTPRTIMYLERWRYFRDF